MDFIPNDTINGGMVKIRIEAVGGDLDRIACRYPVSFMNEMARQLTSAIEEACAVEGLAESSVELVMMFASSTYMEHISGNVTYRRLMLIDAVSAPRDFWVKWTKLDACEGEYTAENILFELGEDVEQNIRQREYKYLLNSGKEKYHNSMSRKKVTEWREVIRRAARRGDVKKIESDFELTPETLEIEERIADLLGKRINQKTEQKKEVPYILPEDDDFARAMAKARMVVEESRSEDSEELTLADIADQIVKESAEEVAEEEPELVLAETEEPETAEEDDLFEEEDTEEDFSDDEEFFEEEAIEEEECEEAPFEEKPTSEPEFDIFADSEEGDGEEIDIFADEPGEVELEADEEWSPRDIELSAEEEPGEDLADEFVIEDEDESVILDEPSEEADEEEPTEEPEEEPSDEEPEIEIEIIEEEPEDFEIEEVIVEEEEDIPSEEEIPEEPEITEEIAEEIEEPEALEEEPTEEAFEEETLEEAPAEEAHEEEAYAPVKEQGESIADRVADIRAELEIKIRLEYETRARIKAEEELIELRHQIQKIKSESESIISDLVKENERLRVEYEHLLEETQRDIMVREAEAARRRVEEEQLRAQIEMQLRAEASERERLAEAARMAIEEQHRLEAENARIARQREEEERLEAERLRKIEEEKAIEAVRQAELERIRREEEEQKKRAKEAMPDMSSKKYAYTSKTVKLLFRRSVDPNITTRIQEIIKATVDYYGKDNVYLKIRASMPDTQTVILEFTNIPLEEMELLGNIIKILGNSGIGIAKAIID